MTRNHNKTTTRRQLLGQAACGFGSLALTGLLSETAMAGSSPLAAKKPHFAPKAKRIIFIFMQGGPSQVDTFGSVQSWPHFVQPGPAPVPR